MKNEKVVTINGQKYDGATGLPLRKSTAKPKKINSIKSVNSLAQRSKDLYSRASQKTVNDLRLPIRKIGRSMDIARSKSISHFAPRSSSSIKKPGPNKLMDIGPIKHPIAAKVEKTRLVSKNITDKSFISKSTKVIKEEVIAEALSKTTANQKKVGFLKRNKKLINIFTISIALIIVAAYFTYHFMPGIQVSIAGTQSGVNATYPEYRPDGYKIDGPVTYSDGEVIINFNANTGNSKFTISQLKSTWDSSAVKIQADKDSNNETVETKEGGLTIYSYNNNATWVNGGILYTIKGNAPLSAEQIRHIATSL